MTNHWHRLHRRITREDVIRRVGHWLFWSIGLFGWALFSAQIVAPALERVVTQ